MPMRIRSPRAARAGRVPGWSAAGRSCQPQPLQHVPVVRVLARCRAANASATAWVAAAHLVPQPAAVGERHLRVDPDPPAARRRTTAPTAAAARRCVAASSAGPAGIRVRRAEELDLDRRARTGPGRRAGRPPAALAQPVHEHVEGRPLAAGERQDLHAEPLPVGQEPLVQGLGLEPLGDRGERPSRGRRSQAAGRSPSCRSAAAQITPPAAGHRLVQRCRRPMTSERSPDRSARGDLRQPERLQPVPGVRAQARADQRVELGLGQRRGPTPGAGCARSRRTPRVSRRAARSAPPRTPADGDRLRQRPDRAQPAA